MRLATLPGVFRPISDSWLLADAVRERVSEGDEMLDPFTGSGILAVAAAMEGAKATAIDISRLAVVCAQLNAHLNGVRIETIRASDLTALGDRRFDLIAANPPYVPGPDIEARGAARAWEGGPDGRRFVNQLCAEAPKWLKPGGRFLLVHSSLLGEGETLRRLSDAGVEAWVAERKEGELGPLMRERLDRLESLNGGAMPVREEVIVFEALHEDR